jgi:hypothetical protein
MTRVGIELAIRVLERAKTVLALDLAAGHCELRRVSHAVK